MTTKALPAVTLLLSGITFRGAVGIVSARIGAPLSWQLSQPPRSSAEPKDLPMAEDSPPIACSDVRDLAEEIALRVIAVLRHQASGEAARPVAPDDNLVFVISSFTPEMEPSYLAITSAAQAAGLRAERVKDVPGDYRITDRILKMIGQARFIVADLTNERPNVYFELGYARGLGKTVITIVRSGTNIHFDVRDWTYIEYFDSRPLENDLLQRFKFELQSSLYRLRYRQ